MKLKFHSDIVWRSGHLLLSERNMNMKRNDFIKGIAATTAGLLMPTFLFQQSKSNNDVRKLHFVGLGCAGCCFSMYIHRKEVEARYTHIDKVTKFSNHKQILNFVQYYPEQAPQIESEFLDDSIYLLPKQRPRFETDNFIRLCTESDAQIESIIETHFRTDETIVLLAGLGGLTGTNLSAALFTRLQAAKQNVFLIATTPFDSERVKAWYAKFALDKIGVHKNICLISNQQFRDEWGNVRYFDWLTRIDKIVYERTMEFLG